VSGLIGAPICISKDGAGCRPNERQGKRLQTAGVSGTSAESRWLLRNYGELHAAMDWLNTGTVM